MAEPPSHLTLVLDLSPKQWHLSSVDSSGPSLTLESFISQVLIFLNAHLAGRHDNGLAVFGAFPSKSVLLYSSSLPSEYPPLPQDANTYRPFKTVDTIVVTRIREELESVGDSSDSPVGLVGALTKALCHMNRLLHPPEGATESKDPKVPAFDARLLVLSVSPEISTSYIPIMNSIFSAQKLKVKIDVCKVFGDDTVFLQQAAHLTGGSYVSLRRRDALLQYLMMCFLVSSSIREVLTFPTEDRIDLRAACFCHKDIVDIGYVCSVCLSIFCSPIPVCTTCRTKFPIKTLQRYRAGASKVQGNRVTNGHRNGST